MSKDDEPRELVPRLRFPQFVESGPFTLTPLSKLASPVTERAGDADVVPYTITGGVGLVSQEEKLGRTIAGKSISNYYRLRRGDFAFNKSSTKAHPEGYIARLHDDVDAAVPSSIFTCFRCVSEEADGEYLDWLFQSNLHGHWLRKFITVGARAHGALNVNDDDLYALPVPLPPGKTSRAEQRKIAECLASVNDWIAAETDALAALRRHKTGLMQQLFPNPGEDRPRLRFPDFVDAPGWKTEPLGTRGGFLASLTGKTAADFDTGDASFIPYVNVFMNTFTDRRDLRSVQVDEMEKQNAVTKGDVFFTVSSETQEDAGMSSVLLDDINTCYLNSFCALFRFDRGRSPDPVFLGYALRSPAVRAHVSRGAQGAIRYNISKRVFRDIPLFLPDPREQEKIAGCLRSLDVSISAGEEKLAALDRHKRGMMQQLFPSPDDCVGGVP